METSLQSISVQQLAAEIIEDASSVLLVDIRPRAQYCGCRIKQAENINFSAIHLRRLLKGVVKMENLVPSQVDFCQSLSQREKTGKKLVIYDGLSTEDCITSELKKHAQVLAKAESSDDAPVAYFIDGGYNAFSSKFPEHCCSGDECGPETSPPSSLRISVSASLPISSRRSHGRHMMLTPSEDDSNRFGPPVRVLPHLVLGCAKDAASITQLRSLGVTSVLNVSHNCPNVFESLFEYKTIPVEDSYQADLLCRFQEIFDFISSVKEKQGCVFLHCRAGVSRSATACIAYIMQHKQWDLTTAYDFVKQKRPCISPNLHFMGQLLEFEKTMNVGDKDHTVSENVEEMDSCPVQVSPRQSDTDSTTSPFTTTLVDFVASASVQQSMNTETTDQEDSCTLMMTPQSASAPSFLEIYTTPKENTSSRPYSMGLNIANVYYSTDGALYHLTRAQVQQAGSISLPTTPVASLNNHLPSASSSLSFKSNINSPLDMSPCRVVAACNTGSGCCNSSLTSYQCN